MPTKVIVLGSQPEANVFWKCFLLLLFFVFVITAFLSVCHHLILTRQHTICAHFIGYCTLMFNIYWKWPRQTKAAIFYQYLKHF